MAISLVIYRRTNLSFNIVPDSVPANTIQDPYYRGTAIGNNITIKSTNGAVYFKDISYTNISYVDQVTPADSRASFASPLLLMDYLKEKGFFDVSSGSGSGGATAFRQLTDTFASFSGRALQVLRINAAMTAVESVIMPVIRYFKDLSDTPNDIIPGKYLKGNAAGNAIIWGDGLEVDQNNVGRKIFLGAKTGSAPDTAFIVSKMNAITISIAETQTPIIVYASLLTEPATISSGLPSKIYPYLFLPGKGTYGSGGTTVVSNMMFPLPVNYLTPEDITNDPNATIYNLDPVTDGDYISKANEAFWDFSDSGTTAEDGGTISYYFSYTDDGVLYYALFVGAPGEYGDGATPFVSDDFVDTTNSSVQPEAPVQEILPYNEFYPINTIVSDGQHNAFPGLTKLADGNLLMVYRKATTHDVAGLGKLATRLSADNGITWGAEIIKFNTASTDYRDPSLFTLSNGNILLSYFKYASSVFTPYTSISTDGGVTFGAPVALMPSASSGGVSSPAIQLPNGDLLIATYNTVGSNYRVVINKSTNGGASWSDISFLGSEPTSGGVQKYTEPNLLLLPNNQILLSVRNEVSLKIEFSKSSDSGLTWSALTPKFDGLSRVSMLMDGNRLIVSYRGSGPQGSRTAISYSNDFGETFGDFPNLIKTVGTRNDVYSAMAKLGNDQIAFVYAYENTIDIANIYFKYISSNSSIHPIDSINIKDLNIPTGGLLEFLQGLYTYTPDTTKLRFRGDGGNAIIDYFLNGFLELNGNGTSTGYRFYNNGTTRLDGATVVNGRTTIDRGTPGTQYLEVTRAGNETFEIIPLGLPTQNIILQNFDRIGGAYKPIQIDTDVLILGKEGTVTVDKPPVGIKEVVRKLELDLKAPLASPALTGTPTAPTATAGTNTTQIATTAFVVTALSNVGNVGEAVTNVSSSIMVTTSAFAGFRTLAVYCDASAGAFNVVLPTASAMMGYTVNIIKKDSSANSISVTGGSTNINGATTFLLTAQYQSVSIKSNGTQFYIF